MADLNPSADNFKTIGTSSAQYTLPVPGDWYIVKAVGNSCYIKEGSDPTATVDGRGTYIAEGCSEHLFLHGPKVAVIGNSAAGQVYFVLSNRKEG